MSMHAIIVSPKKLAGYTINNGLLNLLLALDGLLGLGMQGKRALPPEEIHWQMIQLGRG